MMTSDELCALLASSSVAYAPTGSRYICDPAPTDTDEDYVCLANNDTTLALRLHGFEQTTDHERYAELPDFSAFRCVDFNIIVTDDESFSARFVEATEEARRLNLMDKSARIELFQEILYTRPTTPTRGSDE